MALAVRLFHLGSESLWLDEGFSLRDSTALTVNGAYRPAYYLFLKAWRRLGESEAWLRLPSAVLGAVAVVLLYVLVKRLAGRRIALGAAGLMVLCVPAIGHSQEVRMYAAASCLSLAAVVLLRLWYERPTAVRLAGHVGASVLALLTTPVTAAAVLPPVAWVVASRRSVAGRRTPLVLSWAGVLTGLAAFGSVATAGLSAFAEHHRPWITAPAWREMAYLPAKLVVGEAFQPWESVLELRLIQAFGVTCLALLLVAAIDDTSVGSLARPLALWLALAAGTVMAISRFLTPVWMSRYFHTLAPLVLLLLALGVAALARRWRPGAVAAAAFLGAIVVVATARYFALPQRDDWRGAAAWIANLADESDRVCILGSFYAPVWNYYRGGSDGCIVPASFDPDTGRATLAQGLEELTVSNGPTFLVLRESPRFGDLPVRLREALDAEGRLLGCVFMNHVEVLVVGASASGSPSAGE